MINITATLQVRGQAFQTHAGAAKAAIGEAVRIKSRIQPNEPIHVISNIVAFCQV